MKPCRWCRKSCRLTYCSYQCKRADGYSRQRALEHAQRVKMRRFMRKEAEGHGN